MVKEGRATSEYTLVAAFLLTLAHLLGPNIRQTMRHRTELVSSFGGGLAVAYVFLQLFPEIEAVHVWLGTRVHLVTLVSFLFFYALEMRLLTRRQSAASADGVAAVSGGDHGHEATGHHSAHVFWWHIAVSWLYTWMVIFALPKEVAESVFLAVVGSLAIGLHLIYKDFILRTHHSVDFEAKGRYILAAAPLAGWLGRMLATPSEELFDLFVAVLAGFLMQSVFRDELPTRETARLSWLIAGAGMFAALSAVSA